MTRPGRDRRAVLPTIPGFELLRLIDVGGFSRVYEAMQLDVNRRVAVKVLNTGFETELEERKFENECKSMGALEHDDIVTVFRAAMTDDGRPCIVMKLYAGTGASIDRLEPDELVAAGAVLADALDHAHEQGIFHHDIKPDNIFLSSTGRPALGDFGIATNEGRKSASGAPGFTPAYTPLEFFLGEDDDERRLDIYALGVTLYRLALGSEPFPELDDAGTDFRRVVRVLTERPTPRLPASVASHDVADVIQSCMAKSPADRPATAGQVRDRFIELQRSVGVNDLRSLARFVPSGEGNGPGTTPDVAAAKRHPTPPRDPKPAGSKTAVRDEASRRGAPAARRDDGDGPPKWIRPLAIVAVVVAMLVVIGVVVGLAVGGGDDRSVTTTTVTTPTTETDFVVLVPPDGLTVEALDANRFELDWDEVGEGLTYRVYLVGTNQERDADAPPFEWEFEQGDAVEPVCFQVQTVDADGRRGSATRTNPSCG